MTLLFDTAEQLNITVSAGSDFAFEIDWVDSGGNNIDVRSYDVQLQLRTKDNRQARVADWSQYATEAVGSVTFNVPASATARLAGGQYYYSVIAVHNTTDAVTELRAGNMYVRQVGARAT